MNEEEEFNYGFNNHEKIEESLGLNTVPTPVTLDPVAIPTVTHIHWED